MGNVRLDDFKAELIVARFNVQVATDTKSVCACMRAYAVRHAQTPFQKPGRDELQLARHTVIGMHQ